MLHFVRRMFFLTEEQRLGSRNDMFFCVCVDYRLKLFYISFFNDGQKEQFKLENDSATRKRKKLFSFQLSLSDGASRLFFVSKYKK